MLNNYLANYLMNFKLRGFPKNVVQIENLYDVFVAIRD